MYLTNNLNFSLFQTTMKTVSYLLGIASASIIIVKKFCGEREKTRVCIIFFNNAKTVQFW